MDLLRRQKPYWWAMAVAVLALAGCVRSIPHVPSQNILMFDGDGKPIDPRRNLGHTLSTSKQQTPSPGTETTSGSLTHVNVLSYPELPNNEFKDTYLKSLFECMQEYFRTVSAPSGRPRMACRQKPTLIGPDPPSDPSNNPKKIMIFVHGGMNTQLHTIKRAEQLYNKIAKAGHYPLFINWRASLAASYLEQLWYIRQGEKRPVIGPVTLLPTFGVDVARGIARAPLVWTAQRANDLKTAPLPAALKSKDPDHIARELICKYEYEDKNKCLEKFRFRKSPVCLPFNIAPDNGARNFTKLPKPSEQTIAISVGDDLRDCGEMDMALLMYLATLPSRLLAEPVVDALGTGAWDNMVRQTRLLFNIDDEFTKKASQIAGHETDTGNPVGVANIPRSGGLSIFLQQLSDTIQEDIKNGDTRPWEITLIGHSMGTIIVNQILRETMELKLKLPITNIVYMAAAATVRDFQDSVLVYLHEHERAKFYNLTLHPIAEEREVYGQLGPVPFDPGPRGSLLVLIDNFLSRPLTYLDRTAGRYDNFMPAVHNIPETLWPRVHVKTFSTSRREEVMEENPQRHSDFTERFTFWIEDCWKPEPGMKEKKPRDCIYSP
ncbi:MAG: hypothetical protein K8G79_00360 [bacterium]|uniref:Alpha/beta hydrolase family protein n=1 Tax=Candidatus Methylomirabilis tolerans TaxID=3123416 RepID=A0AAJ1AI41_9BACT|nr:hypothetical protein [Candidatus Methylomirabilis sp.]